MTAAASIFSVERADARASLGELYELHRHRVFRWAMRYANGSRAFAEDLTQDVFMKLKDAMETTEIADPGGWLYRATANLAISRLRREGSFLGRLTRLLAPNEPALAAAPDEALELQQQARRAMTLLAQLPAQQRVALSMKILDGKSQREICAALELSEGYVSKLIDRATTAIRAAGWEVSDDAG
jgi:RNA polymerase sigma factor (sigma-70 family)